MIGANHADTCCLCWAQENLRLTLQQLWWVEGPSGWTSSTSLSLCRFQGAVGSADPEAI